MNYKKINLKDILIIVIISGLLGIVHNYFSETGIDFIRKETKFEQANDDELNSNHINLISSPKTVTLLQAYSLFESNAAIFLDARDKWDYADGHITGAINIPLYNFDPASEKIINLDKNRTYIIYCNDDDCETSQRLAMELSKLSFKNLYVFEEGWNTWLNSKYPSEMSELE